MDMQCAQAGVAQDAIAAAYVVLVFKFCLRAIGPANYLITITFNGKCD